VKRRSGTVLDMLCHNRGMMADEFKNSIRIHPHGTGRVTDSAASDNLYSVTPKSFRKAQDLIVAASKYIKKSGLFSSDKSRLQKMQMECYALAKTLREDGFLEQDRNEKGDAWVVAEYLSLFSDSFPNWQEEYGTLNRFIPMFW
jgi:hypothetical protein